MKFNVDNIRFSIDVRKKFIDALKDIYKALSMISRLQQRNEEARNNAVRTLDAVSTMYRLNTAGAEDAIVKQYNALRNWGIRGQATRTPNLNWKVWGSTV